MKRNILCVLRCFITQPYLTMNDELCSRLSLNCPSGVLCRSPHLPASGKLHDFWGLMSKLFFQSNVCLVRSRSLMSPCTRTCMWSHAAGRAALMHFTRQWKMGFTGSFTIWHHSGFWLKMDFSFYTSMHPTHRVFHILYNAVWLNIDACIEWLYLTSRLMAWFSASVCGSLHKHKDHFFIGKRFCIFLNSLIHINFVIYSLGNNLDKLYFLYSQPLWLKHQVSH